MVLQLTTKFCYDHHRVITNLCYDHYKVFCYRNISGSSIRTHPNIIKMFQNYFVQVEIVILVGPCQKRDIVDTFSHASRATWHNRYKQTHFPLV